MFKTFLGGLAALLFFPLVAFAQAGGGMTVVAGAACPTTPVVNVGNNRPLIGLTTGSLCTSGAGGGGGGGDVNLATIAGNAANTGDGPTNLGTLRVTLATTGLAAGGVGAGTLGSTPPTNAVQLGFPTAGGLTAFVGCNSHAIYDASDTGLKTVVAGQSGKFIYICGYIMATGSTATNLALASGTGADCVTTATNLTPAWQLVANDKVGANSPVWNGLASASGASICVRASAANAHQVEIWYNLQ